LSAGSIDTPKILLLSGVGPAENLNRSNIRVVSNLSDIGSNLRDHFIVRTQTSIKPGTFHLPDAAALSGAREQWLRDRTGHLAADMGFLALGYLKLDVASFPEFRLLDKQVQDLLSHPLVPAYELGLVSFLRTYYM
jgi:choline dehydrogenase-like flavoprotein